VDTQPRLLYRHALIQATARICSAQPGRVIAVPLLEHDGSTRKHGRGGAPVAGSLLAAWRGLLHEQGYGAGNIIEAFSVCCAATCAASIWARNRAGPAPPGRYYTGSQSGRGNAAGLCVFTEGFWDRSRCRRTSDLLELASSMVAQSDLARRWSYGAPCCLNPGAGGLRWPSGPDGQTLAAGGYDCTIEAVGHDQWCAALDPVKWHRDYVRTSPLPLMDGSLQAPGDPEAIASLG